ncbi:hypothetical protein CKO28_24360 [Rhodovibrio sodomensis]|uniref:histidine kinase n=1 Tax=Rhodovibrio sodomensis TaxID=1088 RepID=A0ABS1DKX6_9PROT|nr:PAS domain S-box protein [Rhodovibrio sodomensis]MBK1671142.1 hypothetical protein [Rhodovibrio sodomensis]
MTANSPGTAGANPVLLSVLAQRTPNAVIVTDPTGRIEWVNDGFSRLTGYTHEEVQCLVPGAFLQGPKTEADTRARMAKALSRAEGFDVELVNYAKNGEPYWVHIDCQPIVENGELTHYIAIETDVTERKTLEENLLRAERVARLGHWTLDMASKTVSWSDEAYRIFGMPVGAPLGGLDAILERFHPRDAADVRALLERAAANGEGFSYRKRLLIDGAIKWIDVRAECKRASDGTAASFFGTVQDVTELVDARESSRHQEDRFRAMADTIPGVAYQWVHWPDGTQGFTYLSPNAPHVLGHSVEALLEDWTLIAVDDRDAERFHRSIREAVENRRDWTFSGRRVSPEGEVRWFQASAKLIDGPSGELIANGLIVDTTDEAAAHQALRDSELRLRTLMDAVPAAIAYVDAGGIFRYANRARRALAGDAGQDLTGQYWRTAQDPEAGVYTAPRLERALGGETVNYVVTRISDSVDQRETVYDTTLVPDIDTDGTVKGVFSIAFDVSDYKHREHELLAARERAQAADRAKSAFLATMSHELRTPLNAINGYAEIMTAAMFGPLGNARYRDYAADILASGRYLLDLVDGVLNLSSIEAGQTELETEPVHLAAVADDVARMLDGKVHTGGLHLELDPLEGLVVQADPRALKQVLINLLDNAVKYGRPGDTVRLAAAAEHGHAVIAVCDDGPGIDADDLYRIEQPFVRGGRGAAWEAGEKPGVGLGLALVKRLVEAMHGTLHIDSDLGRGTRVEVRLPALVDRRVPARAG